MGNAITSLISIAVMLIAMLVIARVGLSSVDVVSESWKAMEARTGEIARTEIQAIAAQEQLGFALVTVRNEGQVALRDFASWDVVIQYYTATAYYILWVPYTPAAPPGDNQWTVDGIFLDAGLGTPEVFEPDILNPGEEMVIKVKPVPSVGPGTTNWVVIATPNGVVTSILYSLPP